MSNIGPNRGSLLKEASHRFAAMLLEELMDVGRYQSQEDLLEALQSVGIAPQRAMHYLCWGKRRRGPSRGAIQQLENKVAQLLKRPANTVVIYDVSRYSDSTQGTDLSNSAIGIPMRHPRWRQGAEWWQLRLGYDADWPTYRRLKADRIRRRIRGDTSPDLVDLYSWQWGVLWEKTEEREPVFSWEDFGLPSVQSIGAFLEERVRQLKEMRGDL